MVAKEGGTSINQNLNEICPKLFNLKVLKTLSKDNVQKLRTVYFGMIVKKLQ